MSVLDSIKEKAKADVKHILLPEGSEERTVQAARIITDEKIAKVTLLGDGNLTTETMPPAKVYGVVDCSAIHRVLARVWLWLRPVRRYPLWVLRRICRK